MIVREMRAADREDALDALRDCGAFTTEEVEVALDVLDAGIADSSDDDYALFAAETEGKVCGIEIHSAA